MAWKVYRIAKYLERPYNTKTDKVFEKKNLSKGKSISITSSAKLILCRLHQKTAEEDSG